MPCDIQGVFRRWWNFQENGPVLEREIRSLRMSVLRRFWRPTSISLLELRLDWKVGHFWRISEFIRPGFFLKRKLR